MWQQVRRGAFIDLLTFFLTQAWPHESPLLLPLPHPAAHHLSPMKKQIDSISYDKALHATAESDGLHLLALQLRPEDRTIPMEVLNIVRSSRAAVLLYRDHTCRQ